MLAGNDFVHGETDGFEALQLLNLADNRGLVDMDERAVGVGTKQMEKAGAGDEPDDQADGKKSEQNACEQSFDPGR